MSQDQSRITVTSELTLRNAFLFPIQNAASRRELLIGAALLLVPGVGWVLNMGHRLRLVHEMLHDRDPWPAWHRPLTLFFNGLLTTLLIGISHVPAAVAAALALSLDIPWLLLLVPILLAPALYVLPGFMTAYAHQYDSRALLQPTAAINRVRSGGRMYAKAWLIAFSAAMISFAGLLGLGIGFLVTSVWFWQVAAFCFAHVMRRQLELPMARPDPRTA